MSIFNILAIIIVVGVLSWAVNAFVPMQANIKSVFNIVVVLLLVVWLVKVFHLMEFLHKSFGQ